MAPRQVEVEESSSPTPARDVLRRARFASASISSAQNLAVVGSFVGLFGFEDLSWAYVAVGLLVGLEIGDWLIARRALRRLQGAAANRRNRVRLRRRERQLIVFTLASLPLITAVLVVDAAPAGASVPVVAALTVATLIPGALTLRRVLRHDTWLAVSRLALGTMQHAAPE
jgi:hypothetical protein